MLLGSSEAQHRIGLLCTRAVLGERGQECPKGIWTESFWRTTVWNFIRTFFLKNLGAKSRATARHSQRTSYLFRAPQIALGAGPPYPLLRESQLCTNLSYNLFAFEVWELSVGILTLNARWVVSSTVC